MTCRPDMVQQFAHFLAEQHKDAEGGRPIVNVFVECSLNGRKPQLLIDPNIDLAKTERNLWTASWILPLTTPLK